MLTNVAVKEKAQFGYKLKSVEKSQTLLLNEQSRNLENSGKEVFKFGFGQSPFLPLSAAIEALRKSAQMKDYSPVQGIPQLREKVAIFHREAEGINTNPNRVLVAPGSKILIYSVMAAFEKADVLVPAPSWVSYAPQAKLLGHTPIKVATSYEGKWRVTQESLEKAVKAKKDPSAASILILNYPGNPDGLNYDETQLKQLTQTFRKHNILVVSDEIYGLLNHKGEHKSLALYYPEGSIVTGGLSKWCGAGGWRLGVALLPEELDGEFKEVMLGIASETYSCAALPVQMAACEAYQWNDATRNYLHHQRKLLKFIGNWVAGELQKAKVKVYSPEGAFYLFLDFSDFADVMRKKGITTSHQLCEKLLADTGVALLPGDAFSMESTHLSARLAYVEFDGVKALAESEKLGASAAIPADFLNSVFAKTTRGTKNICDWLSGF